MVDWYPKEGVVVRPGRLHSVPLGTVAKTCACEEAAEVVVPRGHIEIAEQKNGEMRPDVVREQVQLLISPP